jgi:hypothetical protein
LASAASRLSCPPDAHYAVRREALWKKDVWPIASAPPRPATPSRFGMLLARPSRILTTRVGARVTPGLPAVATSSSSNATTAPPNTGRWLVLSSATCAWTTTCRFAISGRPATNRRLVSCAICSTRRSTRFARSNRRSRFGATRRSGWTSSATSPASTSKARKTAARTTGRSGAGIASGPGKPIAQAHARPTASRPDCDLARPDRHRQAHQPQAAPASAPARLSAAIARADQPRQPIRVARAQADRASHRDHGARVPVVQGDRLDPSAHASAVFRPQPRSTERGRS